VIKLYRIYYKNSFGVVMVHKDRMHPQRIPRKGRSKPQYVSRWPQFICTRQPDYGSNRVT